MVFDYIDGAAGDGYSEALNRQEFRDLQLQPRVLNNVEQRNLSVDVFGERCELPFGISPIGMCNLSSPHADRWLATHAARFNIPCGVSTAASTSLETMAQWSEGKAWFQLYFSGNEDSSKALIDRAKAADYKTLVLTVDVPEVDDALKMQSKGIDAVQVSSHGGRQLDSGPPAIQCLSRIREAVGEEYPLFFDSGLRCGEDIIKAYACGANFVFLARPLLFAMAAEGNDGLSELSDVLFTETSIALAQLGLSDIQAINRDVLVPDIPTVR